MFMKKALLLISGGLDSPVAGFLAKKNFSLTAIHFSQEPFTDDTPKKKSLACAKKLGLKELFVSNAGEELKQIAEKSYREYYFVLMKILFLKASEKIALREKIDFLITGESLGQVSSQTMSNLQTIDSQISMEIYRPLLFLEKQEIVNISMKEGFYEISKGPEMCDILATGKPKTRTSLEKIEEEMKKCEMEKLVESVVKKTENVFV